MAAAAAPPPAVGEASASCTAWPGVLATREFQDKVAGARVLAVGAGGIGCELLKTLVLSGFRDIEVIDLDTIETSNLNRQFLFRRAHVGQSKAAVAAQVVEAFAPQARIKAYQANVKEPRFGIDFIQGFSLVLNGLDNMDARRHVNRLCVAAGVPLVESGTAGYVGQVSVHVKGATECYECTPTSGRQRSYPICTLRNTPDKPIHCVVWAKELLFPRLFGKPEVSDLDEQQPTPTAALQPAAANGGAAPAAASAADKDAAAAAEDEAREAASFFKLRDDEAPLDYAVRVFERLYQADILNVISMEDLWKAGRQPPTPLQLSALLPGLAAGADGAEAAALRAAAHAAAPSAARALGLRDQGVWSEADAARVFLASIAKFIAQRRGELGAAVFDKDDDLAVDFVTAASNLRAACYGIPQQSAFDAKGMAGNIIHAIATTNAIVGGLIVTEALKLLAGCASACRNSFIRTRPALVGRRSAGRVAVLISGEAPPRPKPSCMVCGKAQLSLTANTRSMTLAQLVDKVMKGRLSLNSPILRTVGGFEYEEGPDLEPDEAEASRRLLPRTLDALPGGGVTGGTLLEVSDQSQDLAFDLLITHQDAFDEENVPEGFVLQGEAPEAKPEQQPPAAEPAPPAAAAAAAAVGSKKRAREGSGEGEAAEQAAGAGAAGQAQEQQPGSEQAAKRTKLAGGASSAEQVDLVSDDAEAAVEEEDCIVID